MFLVVQKTLRMGLTTDEKEFIVEHYFRPYGNGKQGGLNVVTQFRINIDTVEIQKLY